MKRIKNYIIFNIDTTGLNLQHDYVNSIFAIKIINGKVKDIFSTRFSYDRIKENKSKFINFISDLPVITYNLPYVNAFLNLDITNEIIDIAYLSKELYPDLEKFSLRNIANYLNIFYDNHKIMNLNDYAFLFYNMFSKINEHLLDIEIKDYILTNENVSISSIQRKFLIGINRARNLLETSKV